MTEPSFSAYMYVERGMERAARDRARAADHLERGEMKSDSESLLLRREYFLSWTRRGVRFRRGIERGGALRVGRGPECRLHPPGAGGPPVLCRIEHAPEGVLVLFSESDEHPVQVNGEPVAFRRLRAGDRVRAGDLELRVESRFVPAPLAGGDAARVRYGNDFGRAMLRAVGRGQWLALSLALHAVLILFLLNTTDARRERPAVPGFVQEALPERVEADLLPDPPPAPPPLPERLDAPADPGAAPVAEAAPEEMPPPAAEPAAGTGARSGAGGSGGAGSGGWTRGAGVGGVGGLGGRGWREHVGRLRAAGMDVAVLFDSTGSMAGFIDDVKDTIERMVRVLQWIVPDLRMALVTYKGDPDSSAYVVKAVPLTPDPYLLLNFMRSVDVSGGSAEGYAAVREALESAVEGLHWRPEAAKVIVLIGDAPPFPRERRACVAAAAAFGRRGKVAAIYKSSESEALGLKAKTLKSFGEIAAAGHGPFLFYDREGSTAKRILTAVLGPEWESEVERAFRVKKAGPWMKVLRRKEEERDWPWLFARFGERRVRPEVVEALVRLGGPETARGIWRCLETRKERPWVVERSLYVLDRITGGGFGGSLGLGEGGPLTAQRLFRVREVLRGVFGEEVFRRGGKRNRRDR